MREKIGQMEISYSDGSREFFYTLDKKELLEALREDFRSYGSDLIAGALPCGVLNLSLPARERPGRGCLRLYLAVSGLRKFYADAGTPGGQWYRCRSYAGTTFPFGRGSGEDHGIILSL